MRRGSLTSMLSEFVGFQRTPDFRLSWTSNLELNEAVKVEKRTFKEATPPNPKPRQRYLSEGDIRVCSHPNGEVSQNPREFKRALSEKPQVVRVSSNTCGGDVKVIMRVNKNQEKKRDRPTSLIERIRRKISYTKTGAIYESDEEKEEIPTQCNFPRRRDSTRSEKLFIPITEIHPSAVPIRIVQVSN
ncbi:unnamed protein product [Caenorhabditis angaria]|uniref:Uncharacterized protein n=1 Tax=Caenorhabditis angaria TaxID=860376 RepID=A0A9P1IWF5_9PELO|nr:unnamed protein product [Caenorhabditis angaria]